MALSLLLYSALFATTNVLWDACFALQTGMWNGARQVVARSSELVGRPCNAGSETFQAMSKGTEECDCGKDGLSVVAQCSSEWGFGEGPASELPRGIFVCKDLAKVIGIS